MIIQWFKSLFSKDITLTVWMTHESTLEDGTPIKTRETRSYKLKKISKKTPTHIAGVDRDGFPFELVTVVPMDYQITGDA